MKKLLFLYLLIFNVYAQEGLIQEEVFITDPSAINLLNRHPEFIIDHPSSFGFEAFGPKGMKKWLDEEGISYVEANNDHHQQEKSDYPNAGYPSYDQVVANLRSYVELNPKIAKLFSIGKSVEGRDLWVVKISDNVDQDEVEPEFKYISSMHGDEITGRELTQFLIEDLIKGYGIKNEITELVNNTEIYIMPSMNPDGSEKRQRANANGYDLNRNFPDWIKGEANDPKRRQPETKALMAFQAQHQFCLSANFHGGAVVVNYPWDNTYAKHPLDGTLISISKQYADLNPEMRSSRRFPGGITNGANWYKLFGGMQDWSYYFYNDLQVTLEVSSNKWPRYRSIPDYYKSNKDSMLAYLRLVHKGAGLKFEDTNTSGTVKVVSNGKTFGNYTFTKGEFYRILPEGNYEFTIETGGTTRTETLTVDSGAIRNNGNYLQL